MSPGGIVKDILSRFGPAGVLARASRSAGDALAITFDDGPHDNNTPLILDVLARHGATATFFVQGCLALKNPSLIRRMHEGGHQVANHGHEHISAYRQPARDVARNAETCQKALEDILGLALPRDFRPPHGDMTPLGYLALRRLAYRLVFWSFDSRDSFISAPDALTQRFHAARLKPGSIVLLHDDYAHTVQALPALLGSLQRLSCRFVKVSELRAGLT